jgi:hypothetical protein
MNLRAKISAVTLIVLAALTFVACGPTYVVQNPNQVPAGAAYSYDPGYNPNNVIADAIITSAIINGVTGYYGPGHVFYPQAMYGGVPGYYVGGVFHTSSSSRTTIVNNYNTGQSEFQRNPQQYAQSHPSLVKKPDYTSTKNGGQGTIGRGPSTAATPAPNAAAATPAGKPAYSQSAGTIGRGAASAPAPQAAPSKPNYGATPGAITRSAPPAPARSFSNTGGSIGRKR